MQPGTDPKTQGARGGVSRAALLGLCGGMMLGGLFLLIQGLRTRLAPADCADLSEMECGFMRDTAIEVGRTQSVVGAALLALAVAVVVLMRSRTRPDA
ncbi:hypothetical protein JRI60_40705 [Archangium violaceum]|jgi:hypothetical protein|uniref:hypothetical protein n=1 Tax=Archangium violaceum TaxID=83451 RepID=UPI001951E454|nr:hypothetical protein [Archangium violaceum]QRN95335.1 hypothetical protein JRI60_40705 [Archangium violaceum]